MIAKQAVRLLGLERPDLDASLGPFRDLWVPWGERTEADIPSPLAEAAMPGDGACVVGVIDHAVPFAHPRLCVPGGPSRVAGAWAMDAIGGDGSVDFGRSFTGREIDALRAAHGSEDAVYRAAGVISTGGAQRTALMQAASHGAGVMDLAVGPEDASAPVVLVSLPDVVVRQTQGTLMPSFLVLGAIYILDRAARLSRAVGRRLPVVINTSLGVTGGPRDGSGLFERLHDALAGAHDLPVGEVRMVVPMGNHAEAAISGVLDPDGTIGWAISPDDPTPSFLELHGLAGALGQVEVTPPGGQPVPVPEGLQPGQQVDLRRDGRVLGRIYRATRRARDGAAWEVWTLALPPSDGGTRDAVGLPGLWRIGRRGGQGPVEVQLLRDDALLGSGARPSRLVDLNAGGRLAPERSVNAYATSQGAIRVGAKAPYSGRDSRHARAADGDTVIAVDPARSDPGLIVAGTRAGSSARLSGTSAASAVATARVADALRADTTPRT